MHCPSDLSIRLDLRPVFRGRVHGDGRIEDLDHDVYVDPDSPFGCLLAGHVDEGMPRRSALPIRIRGVVEIDLDLIRGADGSFGIEDPIGNIHDPDLAPIRVILGISPARAALDAVYKHQRESPVLQCGDESVQAEPAIFSLKPAAPVA